MPQVKLPDGSEKSYPEGTRLLAVAQDIGTRLAKAAVAAKVNGQLLDLSAPLTGDVELSVVTNDTPEGLEVLRHSASHVMAAAVQRLYPEAKFDIGPAIDDGFYYDFDLPVAISEDDLPKIEEEMRRIVKEDHAFVREELSRQEAIEKMQAMGQDYKVARLEEMPDENVSFYHTGSFTDLCRGPHVPSSGKIAAFKLTSVAGAYWRGDESTKVMLQRVYGTAFPEKKALQDHLDRLAEAKKRDHRVLGKQLDLFSVHDEVGAGLIHWHPKGALIRHLIESFWRAEHLKRGYALVYTPHIASERIYEISGHLENYAESMYAPMDIDGHPYRLKPMNCPGHIKIYQTQLRSYRDLPIRYAELGTVYRYERSGTLHGMLRVRGFTQDDSHIFCTREQLPNEVAGILELVDFLMGAFQYGYKVKLATRPEKSLGTEEEWEWSTKALIEALRLRQQEYEVDEGGGVFYAPKIDVVLLDALGREWQGPTIQVDLNLPKRFNASYVGSDGDKHETVIVHRTVLGSMERFIGGLIEHFAGALPLWLAPVQALVLPITDEHHAYGREVVGQMAGQGLRVEMDARNEKVNFKIREAIAQKVPFMLVVGGREVADRTVSVRSREEGDVGSRPLDEFIQETKARIANKT